MKRLILFFLNRKTNNTIKALKKDVVKTQNSINEIQSGKNDLTGNLSEISKIYYNSIEIVRQYTIEKLQENIKFSQDLICIYQSSLITEEDLKNFGKRFEEEEII